MKLVSILITCFNAKDTIERTVNSALIQDWQNIEIIIIDDCSMDGSYELLESLYLKESKISLFRNPINLGYPASLNKGIRKSKGEFIAIFDDDDENKKNRVSSQVKKIISCEEKYKNDLTLCYSNREIYRNGSNICDHVALAIGRKAPEPFGEEVAEFIFGFNVSPLKNWGMFGSCTLMVKKDVFNKLGEFDESFRRSSEWDFAIRAAFQGAYFVAVNKPLIKMYKTKGSDKANKIPLIYSLKIREKYKKYLTSKGFYNASKCIAKSNFYFNKKKIILGFIYKLLSLIFAPHLLGEIIKKKLHIKKQFKI